MPYVLAARPKLGDTVKDRRRVTVRYVEASSRFILDIVTSVTKVSLDMDSTEISGCDEAVQLSN